MSAGDVPDAVKQFVTCLYGHVRDKNVYETLSVYERSFSAISERFFKKSAWPKADAIAGLADNDAMFKMMYSELYYRHIHAATTPSAEERKGAWDNYCALFGALSTGEANMQLPTLWLFEMIDEFVYQYQSFQQFKGGAKRTPEEVSALKALDAKVWDQAGVVGVLQTLVDKSGIKAILERERKGEISFSETEGYDLSSSNVLTVLGYYAQIGISRVHVLKGDFEGALKALDAIDLDKAGLFTKIAGANVSTRYHAGFAYFMLGRYTDAIRHLNESVQNIERIKFGAIRPHALPLLLKKQEQMYALLAMILSLVPGQNYLLDESVSLTLHQKYSDKINRMTSGESALFDELFSYASPKFVGGDNAEAFKAQQSAFSQVVASHATVPKLRNCLKMYASIQVDKLAALMDVSVDSVKASLTAFNSAYTLKEWNGGASALDGDDTYCGDVKVTIEGDLVRVDEEKRVKSVKEVLARANANLKMGLEDLASARPLVIKASSIM